VLAVVRRWLLRGWIDGHTADRAVHELGELAIVRHGHAPLDADLVTTDEHLGRAAAGLVRVVTLA